jgi:2-polyprenyl-6-methoxyphenol hydroxylase-like FAD-dependent oxidoreductase
MPPTAPTVAAAAVPPVVIVGGGPVGLASALELAHHGVRSLVLERRQEVSLLRPRAKTVSPRTMEHLRRWGLADQLRRRAPLPVAWSKEVVFCTTVVGREIARISDCFGLELAGSDLVAECGQQVAQPFVEQLFRDAVATSAFATLVTGVVVVGVTEHDADVEVEFEDEAGSRSTVTAPYVLGCDGAGSTTRQSIGAIFEGGDDSRPNLNITFRAPALADRVPHGPAIHYWVLNPDQPGLVGRLDLDGTWWGGGLGVDPVTETRTPEEIVQNLVGEKLEIEVLSTDAWRARMLLADRYASQRVFLVGDAAHQNPPWGGHGFNTGVGDAVNIGWKLAAVLNGWAPEGLLTTYEEERRPIEAQTIAVSAKNMRTLSSELSDPRLFGGDQEFAEVVDSVAAVIRSSKDAEFHSLGLTLGYDYEHSSLVMTEHGEAHEFDDCSYVPTARPGHRLPHFWFGPGDSLFDHLGREFSLVGDLSLRAAASMIAAAGHLGLPLTGVDVGHGGRADLFDAQLVLVRPDQHVAWRGDDTNDPLDVLRVAIGVSQGVPAAHHTERGPRQ